MKKFIITIDTEGDNLWTWKVGDKITTQNTCYLERFQNLSNKYGFKPVWLANYEMLCDQRFVDFAKNVERNKIGEIGMHLHAWSTPPDYLLPVENNGAPYLIEFPYEIMRDKIQVMTEIITDKIGTAPVSHRAGRWAMNDSYIKLLEEYGYKVDCSVTPHVNWSKTMGQTKGSAGTNYSLYNEKPYYWGNILEVPVTIRNCKRLFIENYSVKGIAAACYHLLHRQPVWLRPTGNNMNQMKWLVNLVANSDDEYLMFMLHSSELMPGGSPTFKTNQSIEGLYSDLEVLFNIISKSFEGITLRDFHHEFSKIEK